MTWSCILDSPVCQKSDNINICINYKNQQKIETMENNDEKY